MSSKATLSEELAQSLGSCQLFTHMNPREIVAALDQIVYSIKRHTRDSVIAMEGELCQHIGIILKGQIVVKKTYGSGKSVTIAAMNAGDTFGEAMVYTDRLLPSTIVAQSDTTLLLLPREDVLKLCQIHHQFLQNLIRLLSLKVWILSEKLKMLSYGSIRQKVAGTLLDLYQEQQSLELLLDSSRQELADQLGVPRPSLSRELAHMKNEGLIDYWKNNVRILELEALENIMIV